MLSLKDIELALKKADSKRRIVLPEGESDKIITTANYIVEKGIGVPIVLFKTKKDVSSNLNSNCEAIIIEDYDKSEIAKELFILRKNKLTEEDAKKLVCEPNYFGTMLLQLGKADCMLCGINYTTADTLRPALQIIKTRQDVSVAASVLVMEKGNESYLFSDCSLNLDPTAEQLAEIAILCGDFAKKVEVSDPQLALLSYSTNGSGSGNDVEKVKMAVSELAKKDLDFIYDGEIQFDAAFVKEIRTKKFPNSKITKESADIYVFPDLNSGNIGYKIAQRMGGFTAIGPFILGLKKPINDLSRGATQEDVNATAVYTLFQAL